MGDGGTEVVRIIGLRVMNLQHVKGGEFAMRNILMTVMLLVVVILLFNGIIAKDTTGTSSQIQSQGDAANEKISKLLQ